MGKWTSRKWLSAIALTVVCAVMLWFGKLDSGSFAATLAVVWPSYFAANAAVKRIGGKPKG